MRNSQSYCLSHYDKVNDYVTLAAGNSSPIFNTVINVAGLSTVLYLSETKLEAFS